eukprot:CAMPEP_0172330308 /NCGR_PEP_ID=MMETSP1058-20130122/61333_1 /TAXON_ID=83371 /ORGANISM="Detonula confervacea, Strain CCMP 353" /LENGTH=308 /DNA_ID=CAMNT_0013047515 /DNA_START=346 /DNA_END=1272 /DNA_ORIENTATION=-
MLQTLCLCGNTGITTRGLQTLSTLLQTPNFNLEKLNLSHNNFGDDGALIFANALANNCKLKTLWIWGIIMTAKGWLAFSNLLYANSSVNKTFLSNHTLQFIRNGQSEHPPDDVESFLTLNRGADKKQVAITKILKLHSEINMQPLFKGWLAFSHLLCETSSVNKTFLSNHTLRVIQECIVRGPEKPDDVKSFLTPNESDDKKQVAITKILKHHSEINMQPLFEWDFKAMPLVIGFFQRAAACPQTDQVDIKSRKLSAIYQFIRGMPSLYIDSRLNQELSEVRATVMELERKLQAMKQRERSIMRTLSK